MQGTKTILKKGTKGGRLTLPDFKTFYKATVIEAVWNWHRTDTKTNGTELRVQN